MLLLVRRRTREQHLGGGMEKAGGSLMWAGASLKAQGYRLWRGGVGALFGATGTLVLRPCTSKGTTARPCSVSHNFISSLLDKIPR